MLLDGLLAFLDGTVKLSAAQLHGVLVANHVVRQHLHVVVFVAVPLGHVALFERLVSVEVGIVLGLQSLHTTTESRVLACGTRNNHRHQNSDTYDA